MHASDRGDELGAHDGAMDDSDDRETPDRLRLVLSSMRRFDEPVGLADLAEAVAVREANCSITELSPWRVRDVYLSIYHDHLPDLTDAGRLVYEQERDLVRPADAEDGGGDTLGE